MPVTCPTLSPGRWSPPGPEFGLGLPESAFALWIVRFGGILSSEAGSFFGPCALRLAPMSAVPEISAGFPTTGSVANLQEGCSQLVACSDQAAIANNDAIKVL